VLKVLSPYRREDINRLGDYLLGLQRPAPPLDPIIDFAIISSFGRDAADFLRIPTRPRL
jgi:hypothetical protein